MTAARVVECLEPHVRKLYNRYKQGINRREILLLHTDQGSEFTSGLFQNLSTVYRDFVYTSMSDRGTPTNNAVIERSYSTLVRNATCWNKISHYTEEPEMVNSVQELRDFYTDLVGYFNQDLTQPRAMTLTPAQAELAFEVAQVAQLVEPTELLTGNQFSFSDQHHDITLFRKQVFDTYTRNYAGFARTPTEFESQELLRRSVFEFQQLKSNIDEHMVLARQVVAVVKEIQTNQLLNTKQPKKKFNPTPRPVGDPMWFSYLPALEELLFSNQTVTLHLTRNHVNMIIMFGTGIRCSDAHILKHQQILELLETSSTHIYNVKSRKNQLKVMGEEIREALQRGYERHLGLLQLIEIEPDPNDFLNLNFGAPVGQRGWAHMTSKALNEGLNRFLGRFSDMMYERFGYRLAIKTHGFRRGFVSELLFKKVPLEKVSIIVGHSNISSTQHYNKLPLPQDEIKGYLDMPARPMPKPMNPVRPGTSFTAPKRATKKKINLSTSNYKKRVQNKKVDKT
jgi:site-specific recombinase XerD